MKKYLFVLVLVFNACHNGSTRGTEKVIPDFSGYKIATVEVLENNSSIGSVADTEMSNKANPLDLEVGNTYTIKVNVSTDINYKDGLGFDATLVKVDDNNKEDAYAKVIGAVSDLTSFSISGEHTIEMLIYIPVDVPAGSYMLAIKTVEADLEKITAEQKNLNETVEIGGFFVEIKENSTGIKLSTTEVNGTKYLDLAYTTSYVNTYTNQDVATSQLSFFTQSVSDENITVSGKLVLEGGTEIQLGILDTDESDASKNIKENVLFTIGGNEGGNNGEFDIDISYYIPENSYATLIALLPDLSLTASSDGIKGTIHWTIAASNQDLVTNNIDENLILSKFLKTLDTSSTIATAKSFSKLNPSLANQKAVSSASTLLDSLKDPEKQYALTNIETNQFETNWTAITGITNLTYTSVDAAISLNDSIGFFFSGDEFAVYDKSANSLSSTQKILTSFKDFPFTKVDAAFYRESNDAYYLFSGSEYVRYTRANGGTLDSGYPINITAAWSGIPSDIDAVKLSRTQKTAFFYKGTKRYDYSFSNSKVRSTTTVDKTWGETGYSAITYGTTVDINIRFRDKPLDAETKLLSEGLLFKYTGDFKKNVGKKKRIALAFENEYSTEGAWKVPGVTGKASTAINMYIFKKKATILGLESEAAIGLTQKYQGYTGETKSRVGGRITATVLASTFYEKNTMSEEEVSEDIDPDSTEATKQGYIDTAKAKSASKSFSMPSYEWAEEITLISTTVAVGPIPLTLEAGVEGSVAFNTGFDFDGVGIALTASIPANLDTFLSAGLGIKWAQAGVRGEATLLAISGDGKVGAYLKLIENDLVFNIGSKVTASLKMLQGRVALFAAARLKIKWCGFVPCGLKWYEWKKYIYRSGWLYKKNWTLLDTDVPVLRLPLK